MNRSKLRDKKITINFREAILFDMRIFIIQTTFSFSVHRHKNRPICVHKYSTDKKILNEKKEEGKGTRAKEMME